MGHFYDRDGNPRYEVPNVSKGGMRSTTIADAKKLGYFPSVTEITGQLDKPALLQWKISKILDECYCFQKPEKGVFQDDYKKIILRNVAQEAEKAPKLGNDIHNELELWFKNGANTPPSDRIAKTIQIIREDIGKADYVAEQSFCHPLGFGGKVDLHWNAGSPLHLGIVLDFKTKDTTDIKKMKGYKEHIMQLAAYRHGLGIQFADCYNLFISSQDTNIVKLVKYKEEELEDAWEMFKCLLRFWQINNRMEVLV